MTFDTNEIEPRDERKKRALLLLHNSDLQLSRRAPLIQFKPCHILPPPAHQARHFGIDELCGSAPFLSLPPFVLFQDYRVGKKGFFSARRVGKEARAETNSTCKSVFNQSHDKV